MFERDTDLTVKLILWSPEWKIGPVWNSEWPKFTKWTSWFIQFDLKETTEPTNLSGKCLQRPRQQTSTGRKRFCNHRRHISCSDPAPTSILLFWLFLDLMEKLRAVSHKVNLLCHQESVNHTELCGYNRLESINTTLVLSIAHKPVITSHLEDCQLLQYDLLCDPVVFNDRHRLHHLPIICNIKEDFWPTCGNPAAKHFHFSFETKLCPNKTSAKTVLDLCRRDETVRMHQPLFRETAAGTAKVWSVLSFPKQSQEFCFTTASQESLFGRWRVWKTKLHDQSSFPR